MVGLSLASIKSAKPGAVLRDDKIAGLHMRVGVNARSFYLYYRTRAGVERRPKIGSWPTISLEKAKEIARSFLTVVAAGGDPVGDWQRQSEAPTVSDLCDRFLEWSAAKKKPRSHKDDRYFVERHIRPRWGNRKVAEIRNRDAEAFHASLSKTPAHANRLRSCISKLFNLAERWEMRPMNTNPAKHVEPYRERTRKRHLRPDEARAIHGRLVHYGETYPQQAAFLWLLIYTGARPGEIAAAKSDQRRGNRFELTDHKTDRHGAGRIIFLPPQAVAVLDKLTVPPGGTITGIKSPKHLWLKILDDTGLRDANLRMYDLRHSFASAGLDAGLTLAEIGELLGHTSAATTKRYAHLAEDGGVARATIIANRLDEWMRPTVRPRRNGDADK